MQTLNKTFQTSLLYGFATLAACLTLFTLYLCFAIEWRGPFRDLWEFIGLIQEQLNGHWDLNALIAPYGGIHRILIPKLLFYLDYRFAAGSNLLALSVTVLLHITTCYLMIWSVLKFSMFNINDRIWIISIILMFFFSTTQIYNLIYISDNQVVIGNSLSVFSAAIFCFYLQKEKLYYLYLSNMIMIIACLSHSSSLMIWPATIVIMMLLKKPGKEIIIQLAAISIVLGLYVSGHDPLDTSGVVVPLWKKFIVALYNVVTHVDGILRYIGLHLSSPMSRDYPIAGIVVSYISIAYLLSIIYRIYKKHWQPEHSEIFWITLTLYGFFIAVITAYGRQIYPNSALTDRYQTLVMTYWSALIILIYVDIKRSNPSLVFIAPVMSLILLLPYQYKNAEEMAWLSTRVTTAHTAAITGITDIDTVAATLSHPLLMDKKNLVEDYNEYFRKNKLAYFSDNIANYFLDENIGKPFSEAIDINENCSGALLSVEKISSESYKIIGQAYTDNSRATENVLVMDGQRKIIGLARNFRPKGEFLPLALRDSQTQQWVGFIHTQGELIYPISFLAKGKNGYCSLFSKTTLEM